MARCAIRFQPSTDAFVRKLRQTCSGLMPAFAWLRVRLQKQRWSGLGRGTALRKARYHSEYCIRHLVPGNPLWRLAMISARYAEYLSVFRHGPARYLEAHCLQLLNQLFVRMWVSGLFCLDQQRQPSKSLLTCLAVCMTRRDTACQKVLCRKYAQPCHDAA